MNHQGALEILLEIERHIDVNAFWIDGVQVWPLLRRDLWMFLLSSDDVPDRMPMQHTDVSREGMRGEDRSRPCIPKAERKFIDSLTRELSRTLAPADILFWSRKEDHTEPFADGIVDRIIDPLIWDTRREDLATIKLSRSDGVDWDHVSQIEPSTMIGLDRLQLFRQESSYFDKQPAGSASDLISFIKDAIPSSPVEHSHIVSAVRRLNGRADFFDIVLEIVKPRLVMLGVFYSPEAMALTHACRRRGIPVVDIQHGKQGLHHAMYGGWSAMPDEGYPVLPDWFWAWGQESAANISRSLPDGIVRPRPVVGGNRWLAKWKADSNQLHCLPEHRKLLGRMQSYRRSILVTLQPLSEPLPPVLLGAMGQSPRDWFWLIRTHPHQRKYIAELDSRIRDTGVHNYDIGTASNTLLYPLLHHADVHLTCWSSVAYEALSLGKSTILIDPIAKKLYRNYIDNGLFSYAEHATEILSAINELPEKPAPRESTPYIETSNIKARKALRLCLEEKLNYSLNNPDLQDENTIIG